MVIETPPKKNEFAGPVEIVVQGMLIEESVCHADATIAPDSSCYFSYIEEDSSYI